MPPEISVVIPVFHEDLEKTLNSFMVQMGIKFAEIVIAEYKPESKTQTLLSRFREGYPDVTFKWVKVEEQGAPFARNIGILAAEGRVICNFDADARWNIETGLIDVARPVLTEEAVMAFCDSAPDPKEEGIDDIDRTIAGCLTGISNFTQRTWNRPVTVHGLCFNRQAFLDAGMFKDIKEGMYETVDLIPRISKFGSLKFVEGPIVYNSSRRIKPTRKSMGKTWSEQWAIRGSELIRIK